MRSLSAGVRLARRPPGPVLRRRPDRGQRRVKSCCGASVRRGAAALATFRSIARRSIALEIALTLVVLVGAAALGAERGGQLDDFVARYGGLGDFVARTLGFGVDVVTVSGAIASERAADPDDRRHQLKELAAVFRRRRRARAARGRSARQAGERAQALSEPDRRRHRRAHPLRSLAEGRQVRAIAADGAAIDEAQDGRYVDLPFVVGEGANQRIREFVALAGRDRRTEAASRGRRPGRPAPVEFEAEVGRRHQAAGDPIRKRRSRRCSASSASRASSSATFWRSISACRAACSYG